MTRVRNFLAVACGFAVGCGGSSDTVPEPPAPKIEVSVALPPPPKVEVPVAVPTPPIAEAVSFALPDDLGGKVVARTTGPTAPPAPTLAATSQPRPRTSDIDRGEIPLPPTGMSVPGLPMRSAQQPRPSPPTESLPTMLGGETMLVDAKLPETPGVRAPAVPPPGAADVPATARQLPDRAPLGDPTVDLVGERVVATPLPSPEFRPWFVKFGVPDPFELAEQLKLKLPIQGELATTPVTVPPAKP